MDLTHKQIARFWNSVAVPVQGEECWIWTGSIRGTMGYGEFNANYKHYVAHRVAFELASKSRVPADMVLDHKCREPRCCNPLHLEVVTNRENILRGRGVSAVNSKKTHCQKGHEFTEANTLARRGHRECRQCRYDTRVARKDWRSGKHR